MSNISKLSSKKWTKSQRQSCASLLKIDTEKHVFVSTGCFYFTSKRGTAEIISDLFWTLEHRLPDSFCGRGPQRPTWWGAQPISGESSTRPCEAARLFVFPRVWKWKSGLLPGQRVLPLWPSWKGQERICSVFPTSLRAVLSAAGILASDSSSADIQVAFSCQTHRRCALLNNPGEGRAFIADDFTES